VIPRRDSHPAPATPHAPRGYPLTTAGLRTATFSDGMHMHSERLQILVTPEQRRKLESEAEHRGESVGSLVARRSTRHTIPSTGMGVGVPWASSVRSASGTAASYFPLTSSKP